MPQAVILTALPVEYLAVRSHLDTLQEVIHPQGTIYEQGRFTANGQTWDVGIAEVGAGNAGAAVEAERAIAHFTPDILFFVGIAGGIKDVKIGDVVAATKVYGYESGKVGETFSTRPMVGQSTYAVIQRARAEARNGHWIKQVSTTIAREPKVHIGPIAAGEKVVASRKSELFQFIRGSYNDAIAIEMEGFGFLSAAFAYPNMQAIVIRGISDLIEDKNAEDPEEGPEDDRQERASCNASAFAFELLAKLASPKTDHDNSSHIPPDAKNLNSQGKKRVPFSLPRKIDWDVDVDFQNFTGRSTELRQMEASLLGVNEENDYKVAALTGSGGIGKSALAFHFATLHRDKFPDGVIGLSVEAKSAAEIARDFAREYGQDIDEDDERSPSTIMQDLFAARRMLLIFDNVDRSALRNLRPGGRQCALIITTRDRSFPSEFGIAQDKILDLAPLSSEDAHELLRKTLDIESITELEAAAQIIEIIDGLPLAIKIVGSALRGRKRSLASYAAALQDEKTRLKRFQVRGDSKLNVTNVLNLSWDLLDKSEKDFFACLSVCAKEGFSLQAATAASGLSDEWETQDYLDRLYQLSLVNEVGTDRYGSHSLVRDYAQQRADERGLREEAARCHAEYFVDLVVSNDVESPDIAERLAEDFDDVLQTAQWLRDHVSSNKLKQDAYWFALALRPFLLKYSYSKQAVELMRSFQVWAEELGDWNASVQFTMQVAKYLAIEGELAEAEDVLENAQCSIDLIDDFVQQQKNQVKQLSSLGGVLQRQGRFDEAIAVFQRQVAIEESLNDQNSLAIVLNRLGGLWKQQGRLDKAIAAFNRHITIAETLDDQRQLTIGLNGLGGALQAQGKLDESIAAFNRHITIAETLDDQHSLAIGLNSLGGALQAQGKLDEAIAAFNRHITIAETLDDQRSLAIGLNGLGGALQAQGKLDEAIATFNRQITIAETLDDQRQLAIGLNSLGGALQAQGKLDEAIAAFQQATQIEECLGESRGLAKTLTNLCNVLRAKGDIPSVIGTLERIISLEERLGNDVGVAMTLRMLGNLFRRQRNFLKAIEISRKAVEIDRKLNNQNQLTKSFEHLAQILHEYGHVLIGTSDCSEDAEITLGESRQIYEQIGNPFQKAVVQHSLGRALKAMRRWDEAEDILQMSRETFTDQRENAQLFKVLNTLGTVLERKQEWASAKRVLEEGFNLALKENDILGQAVICNSLGQLLSNPKGEIDFNRARMYFLRSIELTEGIDDRDYQKHLAKVYTAWGQALINAGKTDEAISALIKGFEIDEQRASVYGLLKVTRKLKYVLLKVGRQQDALVYCQRAVAATNNHPDLIRLQNTLMC